LPERGGLRGLIGRIHSPSPSQKNLTSVSFERQFLPLTRAAIDVGSVRTGAIYFRKSFKIINLQKESIIHIGLLARRLRL
jgi:hypothetical protein